MKLYEIEIERTNISPKQFFTYCRNQMKKRTGISIENWVESFEDWANPNECDDSYKHDDWEDPTTEICRMKAYDWQLFLEKAYNFIMEFQFDDDNRGFGYMYAVEFER